MIEEELQLFFNQMKECFQKEQKKISILPLILKALEENPDGLNCDELKKIIGTSKFVGEWLWKLADKNYVNSDGRLFVANCCYVIFKITPDGIEYLKTLTNQNCYGIIYM